MRSLTPLLAVFPVFLLLQSVTPTNSSAQEHASFYTVAEYDTTRDPAVDLQATVRRAQEEGKRILVEVGGTWCGWCKLLDAFIHDHEAISQELEAGFLIMKVNWDPQHANEAFLGEYPEIRGYPHIFVLEKDGTFLYSKNTVELEEGRSYNEQAILDFLGEWKPTG